MHQGIEDILPLVLSAVFMLTRISGLFVFSPVLSSPMIPLQVKVMLALALTAAIYSLAPATAQSVQSHELSLLWLAPLLVCELAVGLTIGFVAMLPLIGMEMGGTIVGQQIGLQMAHAYNPATEEDGDAIGQVLFFLGLTGFVMLGGLEGMTLAVASSFKVVPVGTFLLGKSVISLLLGLLASAMELGLRIAAPILCLVFIETMAVGVMNKLAPSMNILTFGFIIRVIIGLGMIGATISLTRDLNLESIKDVMHIMPELLDSDQSLSANLIPADKGQNHG